MAHVSASHAALLPKCISYCEVFLLFMFIVNLSHMLSCCCWHSCWSQPHALAVTVYSLDRVCQFFLSTPTVLPCSFPFCHRNYNVSHPDSLSLAVRLLLVFTASLSLCLCFQPAIRPQCPSKWMLKFLISLCYICTAALYWWQSVTMLSHCRFMSLSACLMTVLSGSHARLIVSLLMPILACCLAVVHINSWHPMQLMVSSHGDIH